jgi:HlyD family secretion protein
VLQRTQTELDSSTASVEELRNRQSLLEREVEALPRKRDALRKRLELRTDERRMVAEGEASIQAADARLRQAEIAVKTAELRLERCQIRVATDGRVLGLVARPGTRLMGMVPGTQMDASTVLTMYEPGKLQVRADVRLEDVPRVQPGQTVRIETPAVTGPPLQGEVLFATSQADIQKNTLQVKVAIRAPPPVIKPDMLVRVTFLAPANTPSDSATMRLRILIPRALVRTDSGTPTVWIADQANGIARLRAVKLGSSVSDELVEVTEGLGVSDKLIATGQGEFADGARIRVVAEEATLGAAPSGRDAGTRNPPRLGAADAQKPAHH